MMRQISTQRALVEKEPHLHAVKRGFLGIMHLENMKWLMHLFSRIVDVTCINTIGKRNGLDVRVECPALEVANLPESFDKMRILFLSDLHLDCFDELLPIVLNQVESLEYDLCILGGDYSFHHEDPSDVLLQQLKTLCDYLVSRTRVFGILGNHDRYSTASFLSDCGVEMLINEGLYLEKGEDVIYLAGVDDCHYYGAGDVEMADLNSKPGICKLMISHSPEFYKDAAKAGYSVFLCGHTHGGQVCLPGGFEPVRGATVPRKLVKGCWSYQGMSGYTSRGIGSSGVAVRYFCPPEIAVVEMRSRQLSPRQCDIKSTAFSYC